MRIEKFISGVVCMDGGTMLWEVLLDDGTVLKMGRDGHLFPKRKTHGLLFVGNTHPESGPVQFLEKGSAEEIELVTAVSDYLDRTCGTVWRERLNDEERWSEVAKEEASIWHALGLLRGQTKRDEKPPKPLAQSVEFEPRWKEELVGRIDGKQFVLVLTMGEFHVFLPSRTTWEASAPDWARNQWERVHGELEAWCQRKNIPLTVEDHALVEFEQ